MGMAREIYLVSSVVHKKVIVLFLLDMAIMLEVPRSESLPERPTCIGILVLWVNFNLV